MGNNIDSNYPIVSVYGVKIYPSSSVSPEKIIIK